MSVLSRLDFRSLPRTKKVAPGKHARQPRCSLERLEDRCLPSGLIVQFPAPLSDNRGPDQVILGSDGNFWYTELSGSKVGRITPAGVVTEFPTKAFTGGIAAGPDGNIWFTEPSNGFSVVNYIGRVTPAGVVNEFAIPTVGCNATNITTGPDGNLWFTEENGDNLGRVTPAGTIKEFPLPAHTSPLGITRGPDGNLWFAESGPDSIGRVSPANPSNVTPFYTGQANSGPAAITSGPDANLWFILVGGNEIGRITTGGAITLFPVASHGVGYGQIIAGPDGNVWFTENAVLNNDIDVITAAGNITRYPLANVGGVGVSPVGVAVAPSGAIAFTESYGNRLGEITTAKSDAFIASLYTNDLGRAPDSAGLDGWSRALLTQGETAVVQGIGRAYEADKHLVDGIYSRYLGRQADSVGETTFVGYLQGGGIEEGVLNAVLSSQEYFNRVTAGASNTVSSFVSALYRDLLFRTPTQAEIDGWVPTARVSRATVATAFLQSLEYRSDVASLYYVNLLHRLRGAPPGEVANWANSSLDLYSIELAFENAPEYLLRA